MPEQTMAQRVVEGDYFPNQAFATGDLYVARDGNGELYLYNFKTERCPDEGVDMWCMDEDLGRFFQLPARCFPDVQWQDREPTKTTFADVMEEMIYRRTDDAY